MSDRTSPGIERAVAALLGADDDTAEAAVDALVAAERLGEGIALHALLHAARRGTDAAGALREIADGRARFGTWSAYEHRVAAEELDDEVRLPQAGVSDPVAVAGPDAPLAAVRALEDGAGALVADRHETGLAPLRVACDDAFVGRLAARAGARITAPDRAVQQAQADAMDETAPREPFYLDVLGSG